MRSRANWADHRKVHEGVVIACRNLLADSQVPRKRCCGAAWAGFFFNRRFSQRGRAATKREIPQRRGGAEGGWEGIFWTGCTGLTGWEGARVLIGWGEFNAGRGGRLMYAAGNFRGLPCRWTQIFGLRVRLKAANPTRFRACFCTRAAPRNGGRGPGSRCTAAGSLAFGITLLSFTVALTYRQP
jgi:hypothetical protein